MDIIRDIGLNILFLFGLVFIASQTNSKFETKQLWIKISMGAVIGIISIFIMMSAWQLTDGIFYDTRSVLISVTAFFFPYVSGIVAAAIAIIYRLSLGGNGVIVGSLTIVFSLANGFLFKRYFKKHLVSINKYLFFYIFGLTTHIIVVLLQLLLPNNFNFDAILNVGPTILVLYPVATMLLSISIKSYLVRVDSLQLLIDSEEKYKSLLNNSKFGYIQYNNNGIIETTNKAFADMLKTTQEKVIGLNIFDLPNTDIVTAFEKSLDGQKTYYKGYYTSYLSNHTFPVRVQFSPLINNNTVTGGIAMAEDLTAEYSYKQDIQNLTTTDSLTSLKNRVSFDEFLYEHSSNTTFPLSIITCDINTFQIINSTFGYDIGNAVLIKISTVIHETLKLHSNATAYRIGGDEFAIILTTSTKDQTKKMIHSLKSQIEDMNDFDFKISISFGYAYTSDFKTDKIKLYNTAKDEMNTNKIYDGSTLSKKTIDVIMNTLFDKSPREQKHSKRVGSLSKQIAESFKLGISFTNRTELAGTLHDIGKINIPETILEKNGPLSKEERIIINKHPESSYKILHSVPEYKHVANIVLSHHERYDGTGYPQKLKGKYIPLESRIISVADAYDAMTVERAYRVPLSKDEAILELLKHSDTQFDREVVQTFIKLIQKDKNVK